MADKQLECRLVVTRGGRLDFKTELGMYCPVTGRYETCGVHGPDPREVDKAIRDLKTSIERAGHRLTFCERKQ
jgi:hypothetical protein